MIRSEDAYPALGAGHFQKLAVADSGCCVRHSQNGGYAILSGGDGCVAQNSSCLDDDGAGDSEQGCPGGHGGPRYQHVAGLQAVGLAKIHQYSGWAAGCPWRAWVSSQHVGLVGSEVITSIEKRKS